MGTNLAIGCENAFQPNGSVVVKTVFPGALSAAVKTESALENPTQAMA